MSFERVDGLCECSESLVRVPGHTWLMLFVEECAWLMFVSGRTTGDEISSHDWTLDAPRPILSRPFLL